MATHLEFLSEHVNRAVTGPVWHASALDAILEDVTADEAGQRPVKSAHTIAELVAHIGVWAGECERRLSDTKSRFTAKENFPDVDTTSDASWKAAVQDMRDRHSSLARAIQRFDGDAIHDKLKGSSHTAALTLHGLVEHDAYHAGQIVLLKKMIRAKT